FREDYLDRRKANSPKRAREIRARVGEFDEKRRVYHRPYASSSWISDEICDEWQSLRKWISPQGKGNVEEILCEEKAKTNPRHWRAFQSLLTLHAIADEACIGWGIREMVVELIPGGWDVSPETAGRPE